MLPDWLLYEGESRAVRRTTLDLDLFICLFVTLVLSADFDDFQPCISRLSDENV